MRAARHGRRPLTRDGRRAITAVLFDFLEIEPLSRQRDSPTVDLDARDGAAAGATATLATQHALATGKRVTDSRSGRPKRYPKSQTFTASSPHYALVLTAYTTCGGVRVSPCPGHSASVRALTNAREVFLHARLDFDDAELFAREGDVRHREGLEVCQRRASKQCVQGIGSGRQGKLCFGQVEQCVGGARMQTGGIGDYAGWSRADSASSGARSESRCDGHVSGGYRYSFSPGYADR